MHDLFHSYASLSPRRESDGSVRRHAAGIEPEKPLFDKTSAAVVDKLKKDGIVPTKPAEPESDQDPAADRVTPPNRPERRLEE
jgi:hypothetical protein